MYLPLYIAVVPNPAFNIKFLSKEQSGYIFVVLYSIYGLVPAFCSLLSILKDHFKKSQLDQGHSSQISVIMPIYNENINTLISSIRSLTDSNYQGDISVYCSFDDDEMSSVYLSLLKEFNVPLSWDLSNIIKVDVGPKEYVDRVCRRALIITRSQHGGKKMAQENAWKLIKKNAANFIKEQHYVLLIDSNIKVDINTISLMENKLSNHPKLQTVSGVISCLISNWWNPFSHMQQAAYSQIQYISKMTENILGDVCCLPGSLILMRYSVMNKISRVYFNAQVLDQIEDPNLAFLINRRYGIGTNTICYGAQGYITIKSGPNSFLKSMKRWLFSAAEESMLLVKHELWKSPLLIIYKIIEICNRFMSVYASILIFYYFFGSVINIDDLIFFLFPFVVQWLIISLYSLKYNTFWVVVSFPVAQFLMPLFYIATLFAMFSSIFIKKKSPIRSKSASLLGVKNSNDLYEEMMTSKVEPQSSNRFSTILRSISQKRKKYRESQLGVACIIDEYLDDEVDQSKKIVTATRQFSDNARAQVLPVRKKASYNLKDIENQKLSTFSLKNQDSYYDQVAKRENAKHDLHNLAADSDSWISLFDGERRPSQTLKPSLQHLNYSRDLKTNEVASSFSITDYSSVDSPKDQKTSSSLLINNNHQVIEKPSTSTFTTITEFSSVTSLSSFASEGGDEIIDIDKVHF